MSSITNIAKSDIGDCKTPILVQKQPSEKKSFINENDPLAIKVGKVFICVIVSPLIIPYYHKEIGSWIYNHILEPIGKAISRAARFLFITLPEKFYDYVLEPFYNHVLAPIGRVIKNAAVWTYDHILEPIGRGITKAVRFLFRTLPKKFYKYVLKPFYNRVLAPIGRAIRAISEEFYQRVLKPIGIAISKATKFLFITLPRKFSKYVCNYVLKPFYNHVLAPIGRAIKNAAIWTYKHILEPIGRGITKAARFLFRTLPKNFYKYVLKPFYDYVLDPLGAAIETSARFIYKHILTPIGKAISKTARFLFITLPEKFYDYVLTPIGHAITTATRFLFITLPQTFYDYIFQPIGKAIKYSAKVIEERILIPAKKRREEIVTEIQKAFMAVIRRLQGFISKAG